MWTGSSSWPKLTGVVVVLVLTAFLVNSPPARAVSIGPASVSIVKDECIAVEIRARYGDFDLVIFIGQLVLTAVKLFDVTVVTA